MKEKYWRLEPLV